MNLVFIYALINQHVLKLAPESENNDHAVNGHLKNICRPGSEEADTWHQNEMDCIERFCLFSDSNFFYNYMDAEFLLKYCRFFFLILFTDDVLRLLLKH